ncbi:MAG: aminotransferase class I/II-fold pyridoxal phosphate-dependent enzyme, partial [Alicyclobacillus sp.]|nr:aminotransferase class I/II-fold pyridoxal phosphate-dependent enzyme [Alicyclobacillus sp.]
VVVNGFSKAFAMTGWRLGYAAAELPIAKAMASLQSHGAGSPSTISQAAGVAAFAAFDPAMVEEFKRRRDVLVAGLQSMPGVQCLVPDGAFYVFPNIGQLLQRRWQGEVIGSATRFCELLLEHELVAAVPGEAFGAPHNIRLSYATHYDNVVQAVERIRRFVEQLD